MSDQNPKIQTIFPYSKHSTAELQDWLEGYETLVIHYGAILRTFPGAEYIQDTLADVRAKCTAIRAELERREEVGGKGGP